MVHPFAHMNSNYAREIFESRAAAGLSPGPSETSGFQALFSEELAVVQEPAEQVAEANVADRPPPSGSRSPGVPEPAAPTPTVPPPSGSRSGGAGNVDGPAPPAVEPPAGDPSIPSEFLAIFGERPAGGIDAQRWDQELKYFKQSGIPEGFTQERVDAASAVFEAWGLGKPLFFEGRYGWSAAFPDSGVPFFQAVPHTAIEAPHLVVAKFQVRQALDGVLPAQKHPFVPGDVFLDV